jgi:5'-nucleotidase
VEEVSSKASVVILLSHAGKAVDLQIAQQVPGIDVLVGGGLDLTSSPTQDPTFGTILAQAEAPQPGYAGLFLGQGTFQFDEQGTVTQFTWMRYRITEDIPADPAIAKWVAANP